MASCLRALEQNWLKFSYKVGEFIETPQKVKYESDDYSLAVIQRVAALIIPAICLVSEGFKTSLNLVQALEFSAHVVKYKTIASGNFQTTSMHVFEHARNIMGIILGLPVAILAPKSCSEIFLVRKAAKLSMRLSLDDASRLYAIAYAVDKFFKKHDIGYRVCSGTLLGIVRHKGIIPWDDDADLFLDPNSIEKCRRLFEERVFTKETGIEAAEQPYTGGWECFYESSPKGVGPLSHIGLPFVDVFRTVLRQSTQTIHYEGEVMRAAYAGEFYSVSEWNEPIESSFGPTSMTSVRDPSSYINGAYGFDALDFAYQTIHHEDVNKLFADPFNFGKIREALTKYGLPRRSYIVDKSPISFNLALYEGLVREIDEKMSVSAVSTAGLETGAA